ncbi:MAG: type II toxin-antitoxin system HicA family toxin [Bacteroidales bacterium]|nr:type II toxin-antitoxin system HicA family toxin [Bacteroidales bacterium]
MSYKTVKDVIDLLLSNGFSFVRQKGSHQVYTKGDKVVIVPNHGKKGIEKGTYYSILRQAGLKK